MAHRTTRHHGCSCLRDIRSTGHSGMADNRSGNHRARMCNGPTPCIVWTITCVAVVCKAFCEFAWWVAEWWMEWRPSCPVWHAMSFESWFQLWRNQWKQKVHHVSPFCARREYFSSICWFAPVEPEWCEPSFCEDRWYRSSEPLWALHAYCAVQHSHRHYEPPFGQWHHTHWIDVQCKPCDCGSMWGTWPHEEECDMWMLMVSFFVSQQMNQ